MLGLGLGLGQLERKTYKKALTSIFHIILLQIKKLRHLASKYLIKTSSLGGST